MRSIIVAVVAIFFSTAALAADPVRAVLAPDGIQKVEIVATEYAFTPSHIVVTVGIPVELKIRKESRIVPHDLVIDAPEAGIRVRADIGRDATTVRFTPTKPGGYPMYCDKKLLFFKSHREKGMEGVVEVVEQPR